MSKMETFKQVFKIFLLTSVYFVVGKFSLALATLNPSSSAVWPASGIAVASLVLGGWRLWPGAFLGAFAVNVLTAGNVWTSLGIATGNTLEAMTASFLIHRFCGGIKTFDRTTGIFKFTLLAGLLSSGLAASIGVTSLWLGGFVLWNQFSAVWFTWWLGDAVGILGIASLLILWVYPSSFSWKWKKALEAVLLVGLMFCLGQIVFGDWAFDMGSHYPLSFSFIPFMIWAGLRFSQRECATLLFLLAAHSIYGTLLGYGPFVRATSNESLLLLQSFIGTMSVTALSLAATVSERRVAVRGLKAAQINLERGMKELKQAEEKFRLSVEAAPNAMVMVDEKGHIVMVNSEAEALFGYPREELLEKNVEMLIPERAVGKHATFREEFIKNPQARAMGVGRDLFGLTKDGTEVPIEIGLNPIRMDDQIYVLAAIINITERKRIDEMKSEFISTVSHELKTPLTSIQGSLDLISSAQAQLPEHIRNLIQIATRNSSRLVRIVNDILDIQKMEAGKISFSMKTVNLAHIVEQAVESTRLYLVSAKVKIMVENLVQVHVQADADRLMQVLDNLISNAVKFSPSGGEVKISMKEQDGHIRVSVNDQGPGIPEEFRHQLFQKFSQAHTETRSRGGTGLGLWITKVIIEQHGGKIGFESPSVGGTTLFFDLPIYDQAESEKKSMEGESGLRALVCEDEDDVSMLLSLILKEAGFTIEIARTAGEAKSLLTKQHFDVMTLDLALPDQDGISLVRDLRKIEATQELPIVVVSAKAHQVFRETRHDALGIVEWIEKPIHPDHFVASVRQAAMMKK